MHKRFSKIYVLIATALFIELVTCAFLHAGRVEEEVIEYGATIRKYLDRNPKWMFHSWTGSNGFDFKRVNEITSPGPNPWERDRKIANFQCKRCNAISSGKGVLISDPEVFDYMPWCPLMPIPYDLQNDLATKEQFWSPQTKELLRNWKVTNYKSWEKWIGAEEPLRRQARDLDSGKALSRPTLSIPASAGVHNGPWQNALNEYNNRVVKTAVYTPARTQVERRTVTESQPPRHSFSFRYVQHTTINERSDDFLVQMGRKAFGGHLSNAKWAAIQWEVTCQNCGGKKLGWNVHKKLELKSSLNNEEKERFKPTLPTDLRERWERNHNKFPVPAGNEVSFSQCKAVSRTFQKDVSVNYPATLKFDTQLSQKLIANMPDLHTWAYGKENPQFLNTQDPESLQRWNARFPSLLNSAQTSDASL